MLNLQFIVLGSQRRTAGHCLGKETHSIVPYVTSLGEFSRNHRAQQRIPMERIQGLLRSDP
jgi:hypothetical protein